MEQPDGADGGSLLQGQVELAVADGAKAVLVPEGELDGGDFLRRTMAEVGVGSMPDLAVIAPAAAQRVPAARQPPWSVRMSAIAAVIRLDAAAPGIGGNFAGRGFFTLMIVAARANGSFAVSTIPAAMAWKSSLRNADDRTGAGLDDDIVPRWIGSRTRAGI